MANTALADFITTYDGAMTPEHCQMLIDRFEACDDLEHTQREGGHSFTQLNVTKAWPDVQDLVWPVFLSHFVDYRTRAEAAFWPPQFAFEHIRLKRYLPNGRDCFPPHVDTMDPVSARRFMTAMIYLNAPDGGETVFPNLGLSITPQPGRLIVFPPLWLFPHAGLPPLTRPKYILHTYLCYGS